MISFHYSQSALLSQVRTCSFAARLNSSGKKMSVAALDAYLTAGAASLWADAMGVSESRSY
jgi:hypothetical protein